MMQVIFFVKKFKNLFGMHRTIFLENTKDISLRMHVKLF